MKEAAKLSAEAASHDAPMITLAMSGATPEDSGLVSGLVNTTQQVGGALGLAVLATLSTTHSNNLRADGESLADALTSGYHMAFVVGLGLVLAAIAVAVFVIEPPAKVATATNEDVDFATAPAEVA